ncbi:transcriptional repressor [Streptomyces griseoincarnatus]
MTRQRAAVVKALADRADFVPALELHAWIGETGIRMGLTTVYRALHGMAAPTSYATKPARGSTDTVRRPSTATTSSAAAAVGTSPSTRTWSSAG